MILPFIAGNQVSEDLLYETFLHVDYRDLLRCSPVCKAWEKFIKNPNFLNLWLPGINQKVPPGKDLIKYLRVTSCQLDDLKPFLMKLAKAVPLYRAKAFTIYHRAGDQMGEFRFAVGFNSLEMLYQNNGLERPVIVLPGFHLNKENKNNGIDEDLLDFDKISKTVMNVTVEDLKKREKNLGLYLGLGLLVGCSLVAGVVIQTVLKAANK